MHKGMTIKQMHTSRLFALIDEYREALKRKDTAQLLRVSVE